MKSGILAAEAAFRALTGADAASVAAGPANMSTYESELKESWIWEELQQERNIRPAFAKLGLYAGMLYAAVETYIFRGGAPWTFRHRYSMVVNSAEGRSCISPVCPPFANLKRLMCCVALGVQPC